MRLIQRTALGGLLVLVLAFGSRPVLTAADVPAPSTEVDVLSPFWRPNVEQWAHEIRQVAFKYQIDPDLIAAVVLAESHGDPAAISRVGAVGLMGIMPVEAGFEWRPTTETLKDPVVNLDWGTAILADIMRQSGGDVRTALAAYNGGWSQIDKRVPQTYANEVLDFYGRAVAARSGVSPDIAEEWSIAIELTRGNIPAEKLLLGKEPVAQLQKIGSHLLFDYVDEFGQALYVKAFAVPIRLVEAASANQETFGASDQVEDLIMARLGQEDSFKVDRGNPHVMLACLPIMERLNGRLNTRWFRPSSCPASSRTP